MRRKKTDYPEWVQRLMTVGYRVKDIREILRYAMNMTEADLKRFSRDKKHGLLFTEIHKQMTPRNIFEILDFAFPNGWL